MQTSNLVNEGDSQGLFCYSSVTVMTGVRGGISDCCWARGFARNIGIEKLNASILAGTVPPGKRDTITFTR